MDRHYTLLHTGDRKLGPAYALCLFFGYLGLHRIYCNRPWGFLQAGLTVGGIATIFGVDAAFRDTFFAPTWAYVAIAGGWIAPAVVVAWALVDACRIPKWVRDLKGGGRG